MIDDIVKRLEKSQGDFSVRAKITQNILLDLMSGANWNSLPDTVREMMHETAARMASIVNGDIRHSDHYDTISAIAQLVPERGQVKIEDITEVHIKTNATSDAIKFDMQGGPIQHHVDEEVLARKFYVESAFVSTAPPEEEKYPQINLRHLSNADIYKAIRHSIYSRATARQEPELFTIMVDRMKYVADQCSELVSWWRKVYSAAQPIEGGVLYRFLLENIETELHLQRKTSEILSKEIVEYLGEKSNAS